MKVPQPIWDASAVATVARGDLRFMPLLLRSGARYCDVCGHEYCRFTYGLNEETESGMGIEEQYYHHCNRSGSSWPDGEGPGNEKWIGASNDEYHYHMGCCKCRGLWGKSEEDLRTEFNNVSWCDITKPGPNGTRVYTELSTSVYWERR